MEGVGKQFLYLFRRYPVAELRLPLPEPALLYQWQVGWVFLGHSQAS